MPCMLCRYKRLKTCCLFGFGAFLSLSLREDRKWCEEDGSGNDVSRIGTRISVPDDACYPLGRGFDTLPCLMIIGE